MTSVGWLQAWNQAYPGALQHLQNAGALPGAAQPRLTREPNPAWGLAMGTAAAAGVGTGYVWWRSRQLEKDCAPQVELLGESSWLTEGGKLQPMAEQAIAQVFPLFYGSEGITGARELAWAAIKHLSTNGDCPDPSEAPRLLLGNMHKVVKQATALAQTFIDQAKRVANPRQPNAACYPGVEAAFGLPPARALNGRIGLGMARQARAMERAREEATLQANNYRQHPAWARQPRHPNQPGAIAVALGIPPTHYGQPGPWAPPLAYQPHFPANNPGGHAGRAASPRQPNPPTALEGVHAGAAWQPSSGYGTGPYGVQYAPNQAPFPGLPQNAPAVPPQDLVGPTQTIVVGARRRRKPKPKHSAARAALGAAGGLVGSALAGPPGAIAGAAIGAAAGARLHQRHANRKRVSVGNRASRLARNMWGAMASCGGGKKTCGKALDFRSPAAMASHAQGAPAPGPAIAAPAPTTAEGEFTKCFTRCMKWTPYPFSCIHHCRVGNPGHAGQGDGR